MIWGAIYLVAQVSLRQKQHHMPVAEIVYQSQRVAGCWPDHLCVPWFPLSLGLCFLICNTDMAL